MSLRIKLYFNFGPNLDPKLVEYIKFPKNCSILLKFKTNFKFLIRNYFFILQKVYLNTCLINVVENQNTHSIVFERKIVDRMLPQIWNFLKIVIFSWNRYIFLYIYFRIKSEFLKFPFLRPDFSQYLDLKECPNFAVPTKCPNYLKYNHI